MCRLELTWLFHIILIPLLILKEYVCSDSVEEDYEVCDVFDGDDAKSNKDYKSLESNGTIRI